MDYKQKYLKYKQKYLELKAGVYCHPNPHTQHLGECWYDWIITVFIYAEQVGDITQEILNRIIDTQEKTQKPLKDICSEYINYKISITPQFLLNLDMTNLTYIKLLSDLLLYIVERYKREKESHETAPLERLQSRQDESIACVRSIFDLYKINNKEKITFNIDEHGMDTYGRFYTFLLLYLIILCFSTIINVEMFFIIRTI